MGPSILTGLLLSQEAQTHQGLQLRTVNGELDGCAVRYLERNILCQCSFHVSPPPILGSLNMGIGKYKRELKPRAKVIACNLKLPTSGRHDSSPAWTLPCSYPISGHASSFLQLGP